ncbi:NAD(P)H-dependent oxidoreductase [Sphingobacterium lactis]|uniref:NAD(P)H-dependent oxidoreductase n=1 Tax=Sphingobacterium lactis TaxID=797291 RepID=UPI003EC86849
MKIVIILSAIREERKSQNLAKFLLKKMNERVSTELIDLKKNQPTYLWNTTRKS